MFTSTARLSQNSLWFLHCIQYIGYLDRLARSLQTAADLHVNERQLTRLVSNQEPTLCHVGKRVAYYCVDVR